MALNREGLCILGCAKCNFQRIPISIQDDSGGFFAIHVFVRRKFRRGCDGGLHETCLDPTSAMARGVRAARTFFPDLAPGLIFEGAPPRVLRRLVPPQELFDSLCRGATG